VTVSEVHTVAVSASLSIDSVSVQVPLSVLFRLYLRVLPSGCLAPLVWPHNACRCMHRYAPAASAHFKQTDFLPYSPPPTDLMSEGRYNFLLMQYGPPMPPSARLPQVMHADSSHRLLGLPAEKSSGFGNTNDPIMYRTAAVQLPPNSCRNLPRSGTAALQNRMTETAAAFRTPRALPLPRTSRTPLPRSLSTPLRANKLFSQTLNNHSEHHGHHARTVHTPLLRVSNTPRNVDMRLSRRSVHTPKRATVPGSSRLDALGQTLTHMLASSMCSMEALNAQTAAALGSPDSDYSVSSGSNHKGRLPTGSLDSPTLPSALVKACKEGQLGLAQWLVQQGAKVTSHSSHSTTALHEACRYGHLQIAKWLLAQGASTEVPDCDGFTAAQVAEAHGHAVLASYINKKSHTAHLKRASKAPMPWGSVQGKAQMWETTRKMCLEPMVGKNLQQSLR